MISKTYQDLKNEIDIYKTRIRQLKAEKKWLLTKVGLPSGYKGSYFDIAGIKSSKSFLSIEEIYLRVQQIDQLIQELNFMVNILQSQLKEINEMLYKLEGRAYKIYYLYKCKNKSFIDIGEQLGLSAKQVGRIYKEIVNDN
ncbi:hypothetical protein [Anaerovorax odorimutans]|uniref:hypothetical protein n=1 Tax=Anaerovorax odorimutans TaxID=109327 RepID=UPI000400637E|nr:hypothetical protein [Anaerovorax odorimutans]